MFFATYFEGADQLEVLELQVDGTLAGSVEADERSPNCVAADETLRGAKILGSGERDAHLHYSIAAMELGRGNDDTTVSNWDVVSIPGYM
jgi:hypothetical protein